MARDVEFDVTANDKSEPALSKTEQNFKRSQEKMTRDFEREQKKQADAVRKTQAEQERFRKKADNDRKKQEGEIRKTLGVFTDLITAVSPKLAASLSKSIEAVGKSAGPVIVAGVAAAVAVGAPLIGATLAGAIIGGAGLGGVIGGLLLAAKDPRVKAAATEMGVRLQERLRLASLGFVQPAIDGIHTIETAIDGIHLERILGDSAQFVAPLVAGIASAITEIGAGIEDLVHNAGPVIDAIGQGIADIGRSLGDGLKSLSDNGDDAASALRLIFLIITTGIDSVFLTVNALTEMYGIIRRIGGLGVFGPLSEDMDKAAKSGQNLGTGTFSAARHIGDMGTSAHGAANGLQSLQEQLDGVTSAARSLFGASTSAGEAIDRVTAAAKANGKTLDSGTEKGRANREAVANLAAALQRQTDAYRDVNGAGAKADAVAQVNRATFIQLATSLTGSATRARQLADQLLGIPAKKDTKVNANTHDAEARIQALQEKLNALHGKTVNVTVHYRGDGSNQNSPSIGGGGGRQFAAANYWTGVDGNAGTSRTGGPTPVEVTSNVTSNVAVLLDGRPFKAMVADSNRREAYRSRVGAR